jgi:hypothetical protein
VPKTLTKLPKVTVHGKLSKKEFFITDFQVLMDFTEITGTDQSTSTGNTPSKTKEGGSC